MIRLPVVPGAAFVLAAVAAIAVHAASGEQSVSQTPPTESRPASEPAKATEAGKAAVLDQAAHSAEPADLSLVVFDRGNPVSGLKLKVDGKSFGATNADGALWARIPAGRRDVALMRNGRPVVRLDLLTVQGESLQMLVTLPDTPGERADIDITSTARGAKARLVRQENHTRPAGPPGALTGRIISADSREPIVGANLYFAGRAASATTDAKGRYKIELRAGNYRLSVVHPDYDTQRLDNVRVISGKRVTSNIELSPAGLALADYVVVAPYVEGSLASVFTSTREAAGVVDIIGAEEIAARRDSDAAEALSRTTGITVEGSGFIYIRGLDPRYTSTTLNGLDLPSIDPTRRSIPLDLFPADVLSSIEVQKSYTPDQPATFGGGSIQLQTKNIPDTAFLSLGVSTGYDTEAQGNDGLVYEGGDTDYLGVDDGLRDIPAPVVDATANGTRELDEQSIINPDGQTPEDLARLGESFPNIYNVTSESRPPDFGLSIAAGNRRDTRFGDFGFTTSLTYDNSYGYLSGPERSFAVSDEGLVPQNDFTTTISDQNVALGGLLQLGGRWGENHAVSLNSIVLRQTTDRVIQTEGLRAENDQQIRNSVLDFTERELWLEQLLGEHTFPSLGELKLDWRALYGTASRDSPDRRDYTYIAQAGEDALRFSTEDDLRRRYDSLDDETTAFGLDLTLPVKLGRVDTELQFGAETSKTDRESDIQTYQFLIESGDVPDELLTDPNPEEIFTPEFIGPDSIEFEDFSAVNDDVTGKQSIDALYGMIDTTFYDKLRIVTGARFEKADLSVSTFQASGGDTAPVVGSLDSSDVLPAFDATYFFTDKLQLRAGYSRTLSRPNLTELADVQFFSPVTGDIFVGNPDLEQTTIDNYDTRLEWYPSTTESISLGVFAKEFTNPIETTILPSTGSGERLRQFQNAKSATNVGVEFGFRQELGFISRYFKSFGKSLGGWLEPFFVDGNVAYIDSSIELDSETANINTNQQRALQGQAPFVINFDLGYDTEARQSMLLYNIVGERISEVGVQGQPDVMLQPEPRLDLVYQQPLWRDFSLALKAENLLGADVEFLQGDSVLQAFEAGPRFSLSLSWHPL